MSEQNRSALTASVLRAQNATPSKKTRLIDALLNEKLLVTSCPIDKFGWTLLHKAVYENNVQLVDVLLKHGKRGRKLDCQAKARYACFESRNKHVVA